MKVFTNGCFDILHPGHIELLKQARALGDKLIVGLNSDESVRRMKGSDRPFVPQEQRAEVLRGLRYVDEVVIFDELTPENLIRKIKPDVLVKGGDWGPGEIVGADIVEQSGGRVVSIPLVDGLSSTAIVEKIAHGVTQANSSASGTAAQSLSEHFDVFQELQATGGPMIDECGALLIETIRSGGKVLLCGNGGSAADAQHIAAEFVGRYEKERRPLPAVALTTDTSALTALANDYGFERVFARQVEALARSGDCLIAISTSGNSPNVLAAVMAARNLGCKVIAMTGKNGKKLAGLSDAALVVPSERTSRIQEAHITVGHIWCEMIDAALAVG
jgi:D-sedoheptulose 7-phosphate isomerase